MATEANWPPSTQVLNEETANNLEILMSDDVMKLRDLCLLHGDQAASELLIKLAQTCVGALQEVAQLRPGMLRPLARKEFQWPSFIRKGKGKETLNNWLIERLELSADCPHGGQWNPKSKATQQAIYMNLWLETNHAELGLEILTKKNESDWFEAGWKGLLLATGGHPEDIPSLQEIGEHYGNHSVAQGAQKKLTEATKRSNIRAGIKKALRQAFHSFNSRAKPE
jgi:hypothetical protein